MFNVILLVGISGAGKSTCRKPIPAREAQLIEEFQKIYDEWFRLFQQKGLV